MAATRGQARRYGDPLPETSPQEYANSQGLVNSRSV